MSLRMVQTFKSPGHWNSQGGPCDVYLSTAISKQCGQGTGAHSDHGPRLACTPNGCPRGQQKDEITKASSAAIALIGNANARISHLWREKYVGSINKNLGPLVQEDPDFIAAAPTCTPSFSRAEDHL